MSISMILSALDTDSLVSAWVSQASKAQEVQLRKEHRFPFVAPVTISGNGLDTYAICRDLSEKGIGIIQLGARPELGPAMVAMSIRRQLVYLDVDFSWRRKVGCGWWLTGGNMVFTSIGVSSMTLLRMASAVERRVHRRYPFCKLFCLYPNLSLDEDSVGVQNLPVEEGVLAASLDVSLGGMRLLLQKPIESVNVAVGRDYNYLYLQTPVSKSHNSLIPCRILSQEELGNGYFGIRLKFAVQG